MLPRRVAVVTLSFVLCAAALVLRTSCGGE